MHLVSLIRLSWRQKLEICAKGLHYLHTGSQEPLYTACEVCFRPLKLSTRTTNW
ncbi:hypothetical protein F2Q69_00002566 [Brassica cretica]|uniref:Protein kinase domain-containing protein n=1 Tax=Brassica cretica TaxID=69181 RepID=A0A8S9NXQ4_BRACR|nr:hypothetical protein F2Q69_00002566 [Brassica cretica]